MAKPWTSGTDAAADAGDTARALTGRAGEALAQRHLEARGLRILARNYRVARGRSRPGGEIDLVALEPDGTLVFVEVRVRRGSMGGGAAASVNPAKQARLVHAAQTWLAALSRMPPCRFDVVAVDGDRVQWLKAAFDER
jgi:putative endonuclease